MVVVVEVVVVVTTTCTGVTQSCQMDKKCSLWSRGLTYFMWHDCVTPVHVGHHHHHLHHHHHPIRAPEVYRGFRRARTLGERVTIPVLV